MKKTIVVLLLLALFVSLCACGSKSGSTAAKLVCGTSADYAPYEFMYPDANGNMQYGGIDISVAEFVAKDMGKELQVENMSFDYLLTALSKGDYDMVIACMEPVGDRLNAADFSTPYYAESDFAALILCRAEDAESYTTLESLNGKSVGAQSGTTKADMVKEMEGVNPVVLANVNDLINELVYGKVDAVCLDTAVAEEYAASNEEIVIAECSYELTATSEYAIAVQKGDPKNLLPSINAAIAKITEQGLVEKYIEDADALSGVAVEVSIDAPEN